MTRVPHNVHCHLETECKDGTCVPLYITRIHHAVRRCSGRGPTNLVCASAWHGGAVRAENQGSVNTNTKKHACDVNSRITPETGGADHFQESDPHGQIGKDQGNGIKTLMPPPLCRRKRAPRKMLPSEKFHWETRGNQRGSGSAELAPAATPRQEVRTRPKHFKPHDYGDARSFGAILHKRRQTTPCSKRSKKNKHQTKAASQKTAGR